MLTSGTINLILQIKYLGAKDSSTAIIDKSLQYTCNLSDSDIGKLTYIPDVILNVSLKEKDGANYEQGVGTWQGVKRDIYD